MMKCCQSVEKVAGFRLQAKRLRLRLRQVPAVYPWTSGIRRPHFGPCILMYILLYPVIKLAVLRIGTRQIHMEATPVVSDEALLLGPLCR